MHVHACVLAQDVEEIIQALEESELLKDQMWEFNQDAGMMRVGFDPTISKRRSTNLSNYWSRFTNMHKEETLSRLGACGREGGRGKGEGGREGGGEGGRAVYHPSREDRGGGIRAHRPIILIRHTGVLATPAACRHARRGAAADCAGLLLLAAATRRFCY